MTDTLSRGERIDAALAAAADKTAYLARDDKAEIRICAGTACHASGRVALREAIVKALDELKVVTARRDAATEEVLDIRRAAALIGFPVPREEQAKHYDFIRKQTHDADSQEWEFPA